MNNSKIDQELKDLKTNYLTLFNQKDEQSLFYFIQMSELMYKDLSYEIYDKEKLYDLACNNFKNNIVIVFNNMKDYYLKITNASVNEFCKIVKVSLYNKYISSGNLSNIYNNFKAEINTNTKIDEKINVLCNSNGNLLLEQVFSNCLVNNKKTITDIIKKYVKLISEEMVKNVYSKNELILTTYKKFIDNKQEDSLDDIEKIQKMNLKVITNTTYLYLKEQEYFVIEKYDRESIALINNLFTDIENKLQKELNIKKNNNEKFSSTKDYLLSFNNTIRVKIKNIFDEMNTAVTLEKNQTHDKMREFNDLITHIYEMNLRFDKIFADYKKEFSVSSHNRAKFNKLIDEANEKFSGQYKLNISNIFRENIKIYNDVVYRSIVLKSKINEFTEVLSESKVKDLLLK